MTFEWLSILKIVMLPPSLIAGSRNGATRAGGACARTVRPSRRCSAKAGDCHVFSYSFIGSQRGQARSRRGAALQPRGAAPEHYCGIDGEALWQARQYEPTLETFRHLHFAILSNLQPVDDMLVG